MHREHIQKIQSQFSRQADAYIGQPDVSDDEFDLAISRAAFHHFERPSRVLAEMSRVVRPGGRVVVADFLGSSDPIVAAEHDSIERLCDPTHVSACTEQDIEAGAARAGLELINKQCGELAHELEQWIDHGGPSPDAANEIRRRIMSWAERRPSSPSDSVDGFRVRRNGDEIEFVHRVGVFVFRVR
jgi:SAM-dependent methyltransferase